jgi:zinc/manganese transport system permease protein
VRVFALMVASAATALRISTRVGWGVALAVLLALSETWAGLALAYWTDWPTSFWIVLVSCGGYFLSLLRRAGGAASPAHRH